MPNPVVVTRPVAQAEPLAARVSALGRQTIVFPLLEIQPLPDNGPLSTALGQVERYSLVAFVSPNAIHFALATISSWPRDIPIGVVGEGSRNALAEHGIAAPTFRIVSPATPDRSDSEGLLAALDLLTLRGKPVLIVRGESGRELLADQLRAHGVQVEQVAAYRRSAPSLEPDRRQRLLALLHSNNDWLITSSEALRNLVAMAQKAAGPQGVRNLQQQTLLVPHARIEATARELGFSELILTRPGDDGLLAALQFRP